MHRIHGPKAASAALLLGALSPLANGQDVVFSISWQGPSVGLADSFGGVPITEGDLLTPAPGGSPALGPLPTPGIARPHGPFGLGLLPGCVGHPGGTPCFVEVDALSTGNAPLISPNGLGPAGLSWSTDEYATSFAAVGPVPSLLSEAPVGDSSADVWTNAVPLFGLPMPPFAGGPAHVGLLDGDGVVSGSGALYPGLGLIEPNVPNLLPMDTGDDLDALTYNHAASLPAYFSLDAAFPDPLNGIPNSGSAGAHGFTGADVLVSFGGGAPVLYAPAFALGLNLAGGQDDLDALYLWDNGNSTYEPSLQPFDWFTGASDMLLFSVRRGSALIGAPDSIFGIPISEGDILTAPLSPVFGGTSPLPGIFIAAENLGLATLRSGTAMANVDDDLNALAGNGGPIIDCDGNGIEDAIDIALGAPDANGNGVPDGCESSFFSLSCFCAAAAPCGNIDPGAGCRNSTGLGGLLSPSGSTSVGADDLVLTATNLQPAAFGLTFMGPTLGGPLVFGDGLRCVTGSLQRFAITISDATGTAATGPGLAAFSTSFPAGSQIVSGSTWHFQHWYRDPGGPCGTSFSVTNAVSAVFVP